MTESREQMIERREKSRKIQENRAIRAKRWLYTDDKPKHGIHPIVLEDIRHRWIYRGMR